VRLLCDLHISPRTVDFLKALGHDAIRVTDVLPANAEDATIVTTARNDSRVILTQDLDFSALVAIGQQASPSVISLRLASARVDLVNDALRRSLPLVEQDVAGGALVVIEEQRIRIRPLPIS
jgi:predicted nuclease of predicted toxin-antitoxin system